MPDHVHGIIRIVDHGADGVGAAAGGAVLVASDTADISSTLRHLALVLGLSGLIVAVLGIGAAALLTARGTAPLRRLVTSGHVHGVNGLAGVEFPEPKIKPVHETAPEIIRRIVRENPGEITIVAIGPLTNVAMALRAGLPSTSARRSE